MAKETKETKQTPKPVKICDTTLRDGHQSLLATRLKIEDMLPLLDQMDEVGFHSVECWGGATFDACLRYLNEDPWERLRTFKKHFKKTPLQMLLRGQNLLGYKHYPDDVIEAFVYKAVENGMDIIRIFDALNDFRNIETAMKAAKKAGAHVQGTVVYTISPVHDVESFVKLAKQLESMGADSVCLKDMAGILTPYMAYELVKRFKEVLKVPVQLHSHYTAGMAGTTYIKAIEAGCDIVDTALSPLAMGTSQPATETIVAELQGTPYDTGLDLKKMFPISEQLKKARKNYHIDSDVVFGVDANVLTYQIPGGMLSNFASQLGGQLDKLPEVLEEMPRVRKDLGYPPLVTPSSQMVGSQAVLNVLSGGRYKMVTNEVKSYLAGYYGRPPAPIDPEFRKSIIGDTKVIDCRPADLLEPGLPQAKKEIGQYMESEEDLLTYVAFPQVAMKFLQERAAAKYKVDFDLVEKAEKEGDKGKYPIQ